MTVPFNKTYVGCAVEATSGRALNGSRSTSDDMTLQKCAGLAAANNYAFYGLENFNECYLGNGLAGGGKIVDTETDITKSSCNKKCIGDFTQVCGGDNRLSVYSNPSYKPVQVVQKIGKYITKSCLQEPASGGRALKGASTTAADMTIDKCVKFCLGKMFRYAG